MTKQLPLFRRQQQEKSLADMVGLLDESGGWITGRHLQTLLRLSERKIRQLAQLSDGLIITGNSGYKHIALATVAEIEECLGRLESQAGEMHRRAITIRRRYHGRNTRPREETA